MTTKGNQTFDAAEVLRVVSKATATFQAALTPEERLAMEKRTHDDQPPAFVYSIDEREEAMSDFDALAAAEALGMLADQIQTVIDQRMEAAYHKALEVYYTAEDLARQPEHAELLPHVEAMRQAHEQQYGRPIPPRY